jgi:hypothetical protein
MVAAARRGSNLRIITGSSLPRSGRIAQSRLVARSGALGEVVAERVLLRLFFEPRWQIEKA